MTVMKKRLIFFVICLSMFFQICASALTIQYDGKTEEYTGSVFRLSVNGKYPTLPLSPIIFNDRALVPVREIFETLGAKVVYEEKTKSIDISYYDNKVTLYIGKSFAYINGKKANIPDGVAPKLINKVGEPAKTMVPVRFISESLNFNVDFKNDTIFVSNGDDVAESTPQPTAAPTQTQAPQADTEITGLTYSKSGNDLSVKLLTTQKVNTPKSFSLNDPIRLVVDIPGAIVKTSKNSYDVNTAGVSKIRLGYDSDRARIVFDCEKSGKINVSVSDYSVTLTVSGAGSTVQSPSATQTPKPSATQTPKPTETPSSGGSISKIPTATYDSSAKLIVIDAGHGGSDAGANREYNGTRVNEKDLTLSIALKTRDILKSNGYNVQMTRETDTYPTLTARAQFANDANAAIFVSIHINSAESEEASGTEVYYAPLNNGTEYGVKSSTLAKAMLDNLISGLSSRNRGVKSANHLVTRTSLMPASLVEIGFISNEAEAEKMCSASYQQKAAQAIASGIISTLEKIKIPSAEKRKELSEQRKKDIEEWEKTR